MSEESYSEEQAFVLLKQLDHILQSDPLIDEVGFIHPSQFVTLNEEQEDSGSPLVTFELQTSEYDNMVFWNRNHKLGISTRVLFSLYKVAKHSFMNAIRQYKGLTGVFSKDDIHGDDHVPSTLSSPRGILEIDIMKHSKTLLLLSGDFATAWNYRKIVVSKKQQLKLYMDELLLSSLVLSYSPKSDHAWSHRRWVIKMIAGKCSNLQEIVGKESQLVKKIAERFKMNYRAWNHRCWLVPYMIGDQLRHELKECRSWSALHVADNCCFHYCRRLLLRLLDGSYYEKGPNALCSEVEIYQVWKEELDWNQLLINRYIGRESLWLHRRFLSQQWLYHFAKKNSLSIDIGFFMDNELQLLNSCLEIPNNEFEDVQAQALYSAIYILWLTKYISDPERATLQNKLMSIDLKTLLNRLCPEKRNLWSPLVELYGNCSPSWERN